MMLAGINRTCLSAAACALLVGAGSVSAADDAASQWDGDARSAVRLIAGSRIQDAERKYEKAMKKIGIDLGMLSSEAGHA